MNDSISILSFLTKLIDDKEQVKVLQLISEDYYGEELLEKLLEIEEE